MSVDVIRKNAEQEFAQELDELQKAYKDDKRPENWSLPPKAVVDYLVGAKLSNGFEVTPKYIGNRRLMEVAVATLATGESLLLYGVPGTAKSVVSEHLSAAISGNSTLLVQGTAGTSEEQIRYGWNYAKLLTEGPSKEALVISPMVQAMIEGKIAGLEELTRIPSDVQDTLITILSEKTLPVPELGMQFKAKQGFSVIATANNRDKGVNELSSALKRRFNTVVLPVPGTLEEEVEIVRKRVLDLSPGMGLSTDKMPSDEIKRIVQIFRELRTGRTEDSSGRPVKVASGTLSTAEAIGVVCRGLSLSQYFGNGQIKANDIASGLIGSIIKDPVQDKVVWGDYMETVIKSRSSWSDLYRACQEQL